MDLQEDLTSLITAVNNLEAELVSCNVQADKNALRNQISGTRIEIASIRKQLAQSSQAVAPAQSHQYRPVNEAINMNEAIEIACSANCRAMLESFGQEFLRLHEVKRLCSHTFPLGVSQTAIFRHFEECPGVTSDENKKLGDKLSYRLQRDDLNLPSPGSLVEIYNALSSRLHKSVLLLTDKGEVVVPITLPLILRRFWIRFLIANFHGVVILDRNGVRKPDEEEIETPEKKKRKPSTP